MGEIRTRLPNTEKPELGQLMELCEADDNLGLCLACGEEAYGVEPDASWYECEGCGACNVFGAEEILIRGLYVDDEE